MRVWGLKGARPGCSHRDPLGVGSFYPTGGEVTIYVYLDDGD